MKTLFFSLFMLSISGLSAQLSSSISGTVMDENRDPLDLALISLRLVQDSSIVKVEYTDVDGALLLTTVPYGRYQVGVQLLGYSNFSKEIIVDEPKVFLDPIQMSSVSQDLTEITVTAKIPFVERQIDRVIINPDALATSAGNNALEVLEKAPGIAVDSDGNIILRGRSGVAIFVNDKPSYLSGADLESYLRSLPAGSVKRIEIMVNPPARYEAEGNSGVINIILKRTDLKGFYGNVNASIRRGQYTSSNNALNLNLNVNKISLYANSYAGFYQGFQDLNINRFYKTPEDELESAFAQNSYNYHAGRYLNTKVGLDYYLSDRTTLGVSTRINTSPRDRDNDNTSLVTDPSTNLLQRVVADNEQNNSFNNQVYGVYVTHKLDTLGSNLSLDADYVRYQTGRDQLYRNFIYNNEDRLIYEDRIDGDIPSTLSITAIKTDYSRPIGKASRFEAGLKTARTKTDNEAIYTNTVAGVTTPDYDLSNRFLYDENIHAAYVNYNTAFGRFNVQAGLRGEATTLEGNQLGNPEKPDSSFTRSYQNLFPTFYASMKLDSASKNTVSFSYSRRINRPYFNDLNPFVSPLDRFTFYSGNPDLLPTFSNNYSMTYSWNNMLNATVSYAKTTDGINETLEIRDGIYYSRPGNIATNQSYTFSLDGSIPVSKWYSINAYVEHGYLTFDGPLYTEVLASRGSYQYVQMNNAFQLGKGWKADFSGNYRSNMVYSQLLLKSYWQVNMGVQKPILNGKGNIKLAVDDIFYSRRGDGVINNLRLTDADWNSVSDTRRVSLAFSWKFGNAKTAKQKRNSSGSDSEQNRVRS